MESDPVVDEIRRIRKERDKRCNYDLHAICEDIRRRQQAKGRHVITRPPRKPDAHAKA